MDVELESLQQTREQHTVLECIQQIGHIVQCICQVGWEEDPYQT